MSGGKIEGRIGGIPVTPDKKVVRMRVRLKMPTKMETKVERIVGRRNAKPNKMRARMPGMSRETTDVSTI